MGRLASDTRTARGGRPFGTRWPRLPAGRQALLTLAHLRCGDTYAQLATGFRIGVATVYRYMRKAIDVLAALAPTLTEAMKSIRTKAFVILDVTLLSIDRITADTPYYSGHHKRHGMNVQILTDPFGRLNSAPSVDWPTRTIVSLSVAPDPVVRVCPVWRRSQNRKSAGSPTR